MKHFLFCMLLITTGYPLAAQPRIHAHNDYQQSLPLTNALHNEAYSIEADVYLTSRGLVVAHDKKDIAMAPSLDSLYLQPIIRLFKKHHGRISKSKPYAPVLMIDVKESLLQSGGTAVITALIRLLAKHPSVFDRSVNSMAVQLVISGDRGTLSSWASYPSNIFFDGRPYEVYDSVTLQRVAFISDAYYNYVTVSDSTGRIKQLVNKIHGMDKLLRLWAIPDNAASWQRLQQLGVDIINTDMVGECREYFLKANR
jgi:hypothetical protein